MNSSALPPMLEQKFDTIYGEGGKDSYIHDMKTLADNPKKKMMVDDDGKIVNIGKGRLVWENIKGAFGAVNHTKKALVEYRFMQLVKYGADQNWIQPKSSEENLEIDEEGGDEGEQTIDLGEILKVAARLGLVPGKVKSIQSHYELSELITNISAKAFLEKGKTVQVVDSLKSFVNRHKFALESHSFIVRGVNALFQLFKPEKLVTYSLYEFKASSKAAEDGEEADIAGGEKRNDGGEDEDDRENLGGQTVSRRSSVDLDNIQAQGRRASRGVDVRQGNADRASVGPIASAELQPAVGLDILSILEGRTEKFKEGLLNSDNLIDFIMPAPVESDNDALVRSWVAYTYLPGPDEEKEKRLDEGLAQLDATNQLAVLSIGYQISKLREANETVAEEKMPGAIEQSQADAKMFGDRLRNLVNENGELDLTLDEKAYFFPLDEGIYDEKFVKVIKDQKFEKQTGDTYNYMKKVGYFAIAGVGAGLAALTFIPAAPVVATPVVATWVWVVGGAAVAAGAAAAVAGAKRFFGGQGGAEEVLGDEGQPENPDLTYREIKFIVPPGQENLTLGEGQNAVAEEVKEEAVVAEGENEGGKEEVLIEGQNVAGKEVKEGGVTGLVNKEEVVVGENATVGEAKEEAVAEKEVFAEGELVENAGLDNAGLDIEEFIGEKELDDDEVSVGGESVEEVGLSSGKTVEPRMTRRSRRRLKQATNDINILLKESKDPETKTKSLSRPDAQSLYKKMIQLKNYFKEYPLSEYPNGNGVSTAELHRFIINYGGAGNSSLLRFYKDSPAELKEITENFEEFNRIELGIREWVRQNNKISS